MKSPLGASDLFAFFLFLNMHFFEPKKAALGEKSRHTRAGVTRCVRNVPCRGRSVVLVHFAAHFSKNRGDPEPLSLEVCRFYTFCSTAKGGFATL